MEQAIETFTKVVPPGTAGLFFFAGHSAQLEGVNYLLPTGAVFSATSDVKPRAVAADWVLGRMDDAGMEVKLLILDACRNNPFGRSWTRAISRGLAPMETPKGSYIAYATSPGKTAADGTGRNSPYTAHLLRELPVPGRPKPCSRRCGQDSDAPALTCQHASFAHLCHSHRPSSGQTETDSPTQTIAS